MQPILTILLLGIASTALLHAEQSKTRIAPWTSGLKCLAPLAREARSGEGPLKLDQAFFDGPFRQPERPEELPVWARDYEGISDSEYDRLLSRGYELALFFDDREAERCFRACISLDPERPDGFLGLAAVNSADPRRYRCFLEAAEGKVGKGSSDTSRWAGIMAEHPVVSRREPRLWLELVRSQLREDHDPFQAIVFLRNVAIFSSGGLVHPVDGDIEKFALEFPTLPIAYFVAPDFREESNRLPPVSGAPIALRLLADRYTLESDESTAFQLRTRSLEEELTRLEQIGTVMPEAALAIGQTLDLQLRSQFTVDPAAALKVARQALAWPRDVHSIGQRWRRLQREETLWVIGRNFLAENALRKDASSGLDEIPRGFLPSDKAEWLAWKAIAEGHSGGKFNPWLAGLRREADSERLTAVVEEFFAWKNGETDTPPSPVPGLPPEWFDREPLRISGIPPGEAQILDLTPRRRPAPDFALPDGMGGVRTISEFRGRPVVVIFFLGGGCLHCVEQLTAFGPWAERFSEAGIDLVAVSTDKVEYLSEAISRDASFSAAFPFPVVSDSELGVFRAWGVVDEFDERALHGTFLVSSVGEIIWQETGNTPYMHPDFLFWEAKRLLEPRQD